MINIFSKPTISENIVWRKDGKRNEIISLADFRGGPIRFLNPLGSKIFELCDGTNTIDEIQKSIKSHFNKIDKEIIEKDVLEFLIKLSKNKLINLK